MILHTLCVVPLTDRDEVAIDERALDIEIVAYLIDRPAGTRNGWGIL